MRQRGFSLIEIILFIAIVGVAMAGISATYVNATAHSHEPYLRQRALAVANAYMDEILRKRWNENTPIGGGCINTGSSCAASAVVPVAIGDDEGGVRSNYDDVDDYNALAGGQLPTDSNGTAMPGYAGFNVKVEVTQPAAAWNALPAADVRLIKVTVTSPNGETIALDAYRVNY